MNYKVNLSDVIKVVIFVAGLVGTCYSMKYDQLRETNLGVIKNDIEYIKKGQEETQDDLQQYYKAVNEFITLHTSNHQ